MSRQMLSASTGSVSRRERWAFARAGGTASRERGLSSKPLTGASLPERREEPLERIEELVDHPLLERDDRVVGDRDALRADLGAALGDVAIADTLLAAQVGHAVLDVERMHLERGARDQQARADEAVVQVVLAQYVADVLAEEALDALPELLHAVDVGLRHAPGAVRRVGR